MNGKRARKLRKAIEANKNIRPENKRKVYRWIKKQWNKK